MIENNQIPLLNELIDAYEKSEIKEEGKWYSFYFTNEHKNNKSVGWVPDSQFKGLLDMRIYKEKFIADLLWGK